MALASPAPAPNDLKRVKVYELKNSDWYDRGTGFCTGTLLATNAPAPESPGAHVVVVVSEDDPNRTLLETRVSKDDGYQKQQETLIVWTESNGVDMALSFQEPAGCALIWDFVSEAQTRLNVLVPDDSLPEELLPPGPVFLPEPQLGRLDEIEAAIRAAQMNPAGRDALIKLIMNPDAPYIMKLTPLVDAAERLESLGDLHKLCIIMKYLILLNDTSIIEFVVTDQAIMGVVGALEYDPDFPSHRANHRQYLSDSSKFKEVVPIENADIRREIHYTYRLLYLKDVVLARFLDDPTFSVLNSLIFFHQVDIVNHLQSNQDFLRDLFAIFDSDADSPKKKEAVAFIQACCAISKSIQAQNRAQLFHHFIQHGLFKIIVLALKHPDAALRVHGTDILVALIDHDAHMVRNHIFAAIKAKAKPLTDTLIELLLVEVDLGVKSQMADAIKILLDPGANQPPMEMVRGQNGEYVAKQRGQAPPGHPAHSIAPQTEAFISSFYEDSAKRLFQPLKDLEFRQSMTGMSVHETSLYAHLVEVLSFFLRSHSHKSKLFILTEDLHSRVAQLFACPQRHMKLTALKWFRTCIGLQDDFHNRQIIQNFLFEPILDIAFESMPRDNLINSACLEMFEFIKHEDIKYIVPHIVENYRDRLMTITHVDTFRALIYNYDLALAKAEAAAEESTATTSTEEIPNRTVNGQPYTGLKEDAEAEAYFNADDGEAEDDEDGALPTAQALPNGPGPARPLVNYADEDDEGMDLMASSPDVRDKKGSSDSSSGGGTNNDSSDPTTAESLRDSVEESPPPSETERGRDRRPVPVEGAPGAGGHRSPPESLATKRRRDDDDDDDELGKMMGGQTKRRNSSASVSARLHGATLQDNNGLAVVGNGGHASRSRQQQQQQHQQREGEVREPSTTGHMLRRTKSMKTRNEGPLGSKLAIKPISISPAVRAEDGEGNGGGGG